MKRSTFITWDQLKVGAMILVALLIMIVAIIKLGAQAKLFTSRYSLVAFVPTTAGLKEGSQVTVAGQLVGAVKKIDFLPVDLDTSRNLKITVELDPPAALSEAVRQRLPPFPRRVFRVVTANRNNSRPVVAARCAHAGESLLGTAPPAGLPIPANVAAVLRIKPTRRGSGSSGRKTKSGNRKSKGSKP